MNGVDDTRRRGKKARLRLHANRRKRKWNTGRVIYFDGTRTRLISKEESDKIANNGCAQTADSGPSVSCTDHPPCRDSRDDCYANTNERSSELSVTPQRLSLENSEPGCSYWPNIYMEKATPEKMASNSSDLSSANGCQDELDIHTQGYILDISDVSLLPLSPEGDVNSSRQSEFPAFPERTESYTTAPEPNTSISTPAIIEGRRIFDINHLFSEISRISRHSKIFDCSFDNMVLLKEERKRMESIYHFECSMCGLKEKISSEFPKSTKRYMSINDSWVSSMLLTGQGFTQLRDIASNLEIPCMAKETFQRRQRHLSSVIKEVAWLRMQEAGREEASLALEVGEVDEDGVPVITVVTDGAWSKRSYGTNFNALSGVACIIGAKTKKVLFISTRNAYCCICERASSKDETVKPHVCHKNWAKSSTAMEADIIVEGFRNSIEMHNLKYNKLIGDGDSSVMKQLITSQPYGPNFSITKIECKNHIIRNYNRRLRDIASKTKNTVGPVPAAVRRVLDPVHQLRLRVAVTSAIKYRSTQNLPLQERINELQKDIHNGPFHVFGDHGRCQERGYFCKGPKDGEVCVVEELKAVGMWDEIMSAKNLVAHHASSLVHNVSTNNVERFNSILCKFVGGKRVNFSLRGGYDTRCNISVIEHNTKGETQRMLHKQMTLQSPGLYCTNNIRNKQRSAQKRRKRQQGNPKKTKRKKLNMTGPDCHYGNVNSELEMTEEEFRSQKEHFLQKLSLNNCDRNSLQTNTNAQYNSHLWLTERSKRVTASSFGRICKMKSSTPRAKSVISMIYSSFHGTKATKYGLEKEPLALEQLAKALGKSVMASGLFVDKDMPWLAATPDGLIDSDSIVEVKSPFNASHVTPQQAIVQNKIKFCRLESGELRLKEDDRYMYQIQGQLHIAQRKICYFVIWTPLGMLVQKIERDMEFWKTKMVQKLNNFYMDFMLPELIDPRYPKGLPLRDIRKC